MTTKLEEHDLNRDPITGAPGSHPLGTGAGAAGAAAVGAAIGAVVGGPVGFVVGGAVGAVAGGVAGHDAAEAVNPTIEDAFWRENYSRRPYFVAERDYGHYQPAYRYGWEARGDYKGQSWDEIESVLNTGWYSRRGASPLEWADAKLATRDAWERIGGLQY